MTPEEHAYAERHNHNLYRRILLIADGHYALMSSFNEVIMTTTDPVALALAFENEIASPRRYSKGGEPRTLTRIDISELEFRL